MKSLVCTFFLFFYCSLLVLSQNLVPNPSFEDYNRCPDFLGSVKSYNFNSPWGIVAEWQANPPDCTPDYFHPCGKKKFRVPKNLCGEIPTKDGEAYLGMILRIGAVYYGHPSDMLYREHVTAQLTQELKKNYQYLVKFHVALSKYSNYAIGNIGALFTKEAIIIKENRHHEPQVCSKQNLIKRKNSWMVIQDTLQAQGGEKFITLGNFDEYGKRKIRKITKDKRYQKKFNYNRAYYYIDDVSVIEIGPMPLNTVPVVETPQDSILITENGAFKIGKKIILENIFFAFDKSDLLPESFPELDKLVKILKNAPKINITLIGHTDSIGTLGKNQVLSENRAKSVLVYLHKQGILPGRMQAIGYGETQPITSNGTPQGRSTNRRVEFVLSHAEKGK